MPIIPIDPNDSRLAPYRDLRVKRGADVETFVVEGAWLVERLANSRFELRSVLVGPHQVARARELVADDVPIFQLPESAIHDVVGFHFHRGMLGCGVRLPFPDLESLVPAEQDTHRLLICPELRNEDNLGSLIRTAAAFGVTGVLLGTLCPDPFGRRVMRVSMGTAFHVPIRQTETLLDELQWLRSDRDVSLIGSVLCRDAEVVQKETHVDGRWGLLVGREDDGLSREWLDVCSRRLMIEMAGETDSLNVGVAAGVLLYQLGAVSRPENR